MTDWIWALSAVLFVIVGPVIGLLLAGIDRKISARMQNRVGPPIRQPLYDVKKFLAKEQVTPNRVQDFYVMCFLLFTIITGAMFFGGMDLLLVIFTLTLSETFLVLAAYSSGSVYSQIGAQRELYVAMAYEPIILLMAICYYLEYGSFAVSDIVGSGEMAFIPLIGVFVAFLFGLTMKLRKSPFDLSLSHHAHQDIVRGMATEFSGRTYASLEIAHWYESVMLLGMMVLFFLNGSWTGAVLGIVIAVLAWILEIWIDNGFARMKWQTALKSGWIVGLILGVGNVAVLLLI